MVFEKGRRAQDVGYDFMRVYLDNCCYNRPYDPQGDLRIVLETLAKLQVQHLMRIGF